MIKNTKKNRQKMTRKKRLKESILSHPRSLNNTIMKGKLKKKPSKEKPYVKPY